MSRDRGVGEHFGSQNFFDLFRQKKVLRDDQLTNTPGIFANKERLREAVENSIGLATALNRHIGYKAATMIALEAQATGKGRIVVSK